MDWFSFNYLEVDSVYFKSRYSNCVSQYWFKKSPISFLLQNLSKLWNNKNLINNFLKNVNIKKEINERKEKGKMVIRAEDCGGRPQTE